MNPMMLRRVIAAGATSFGRNGAVSFATVLIMTVTLLIAGSLLFLSALLSHTLEAIEGKVDVNVYFVTTAAESEIEAVADDLRALPQVASVTYTSREDALAEFRLRHETDQLTLQALDELGENPFGASLAVKATDPGEYESIVTFLSEEPALSAGGTSIVDRVNYYQNKIVIDRLNAAADASERAGAVVIFLFALASAIIVLATIRLAIYTARDEIAVMRLVGASNFYIRTPFIVSGILAGLIAAAITLALFYPASFYLGSSLAEWLGGWNPFSYYLSSFPMIAGIIIGSGIVLGGVASYIAVRRYLKI